MSRRRILVTGGTSGIGRSVVERLSADGAAVAFTGRNQERGEAVAGATGAHFLAADLTDPGSGEESSRWAAETLGGLDGLVHNAGVDYEGPLAETADEVWDVLLETNLFAALRQVNGAVPHLRESEAGAVAIVSSDAGLWPEVGVAAYSVVKRSVIALGQMLAVGLAAENIRVNVVSPGDIAPGMRSTAQGYGQTGDPDEWFVPPIGRIGQPEDVAAAIAFLVGPDAAFCTGSTLLVDGGMRASTGPIDGAVAS